MLYQGDFHDAENNDVRQNHFLFASQAVASGRIEVPGVFQIVFHTVVLLPIDEIYLLLVLAMKQNYPDCVSNAFLYEQPINSDSRQLPLVSNGYIFIFIRLLEFLWMILYTLFCRHLEYCSWFNLVYLRADFRAFRYIGWQWR